MGRAKSGERDSRGSKVKRSGGGKSPGKGAKASVAGGRKAAKGGGGDGSGQTPPLAKQQHSFEPPSAEYQTRKAAGSGKGHKGRCASTKSVVDPEPVAITAADYNPRMISADALAGLRASMATFGDLSGFVVNRRTGNVVCGHQRREALGAIDLGAVAYGEPFEVELGPEDGRFTAIERSGEVIGPGGSRFRVRMVDWPEGFEKAANLAANNPAIQGEFTEQAAALLEELQASNPELTDDVMLDELLNDLRKTAGGAGEVKAKAVPECWQVAVEVSSEDEQRRLFERLKGEGYQCRLLTM